jgi:hypothetical protein
MMMTNIIVKLQVEGIHFWKDCDIEDVDFLANPHRHIFHITCKKEVTHDDRDIEIIRMKRQVLLFLEQKYAKTPSVIKGTVCWFGGMSCEMIARVLLEKFELNYCKVLEDNENGAEICLK